MGPEIANFRAIIGLLWPTVFLAKMSILNTVQYPVDIATLDIAAALPNATSTPVTNLRQYINSDLGYNDLKFQGFFVLI